MATRYSGDLKISIRLQSDSTTYSAKINFQDGRSLHITMKGLRLSPYAQARIAADSKEAFDEIARAALSFATADEEYGYMFENYARLDDAGEIVVQRRYAGENVQRGVAGVPA